MSDVQKDFLGRYSLEILVIVTVLAIAVTPVLASAAAGLVALLLFGPFLLLLRPKGLGFGREGFIVAASVAGLAVAALLFTFSAVSPSASFLGRQGQHTGSLLWLAAAAVLVAVLMTARPGDVGRMSRVLTVAGAVLALSAVLDATGLFPVSRFSPEPAGMMESSISLGQVLVVSVGCGIGWALAARSLRERVFAMGALAIIAAGLAVSQAHSAMLALVLAAVVVGASASIARRWTALTPYMGWLTAGTALVLLGVASLLLMPGTGRAQEFARLTNDRSVIWSSAFASAADAPLLGKGPEQFSAWVSWDSEPAVSLSKTGTYDPHNILIYWLMAGGIVGLAALAAVGGVVLGRLWVVAQERELALGILSLIGAVLAWGMTVMFGWMSPVALLFVALVVGTLLSSHDAGKERRKPLTSKCANLFAGALVVSVAVLAALSCWRPLASEYRWASLATQETMDIQERVRLSKESADPGMAAGTVGDLVASAAGDPSQAEDLIATASELEPILEHDAVWHVDAAYEGFQLAFARIVLLGEGEWEDADRYIEAGKKADPASGLWDYVGAASALQIDEEEAARQHAASALDHPLPDDVRAWCEWVATGARP